MLKLAPGQEKAFVQAAIPQPKRKNRVSFKDLTNKYHLVKSMVAVVRAVATHTMVLAWTVTLIHKKDVRHRLWSSFCPLIFDAVEGTLEVGDEHPTSGPTALVPLQVKLQAKQLLAA